MCVCGTLLDPKGIKVDKFPLMAAVKNSLLLLVLLLC